MFNAGASSILNPVQLAQRLFDLKDRNVIRHQVLTDPLSIFGIGGGKNTNFYRATEWHSPHRL